MFITDGMKYSSGPMGLCISCLMAIAEMTDEEDERGLL